MSNLDRILDDLARSVSDKSIEAAASVAKLYGADADVVAAILRLKSKEKEAA